MSVLHRVSTSAGSDHLADVVFLHGLGGDAFKTWRHGNDQSTSWPHWLAEEFPDVGIWLLGYAASPTKRARGIRKLISGDRDAGHAMPLPDRAREVVDLMVQNQLGNRPLLLIGHSLGGLLAKQILRRASDDTRDDHHCIFTNTKAVLFLGTPHQGASLASMADRFRAVFGPTANMEDLRAHDPHLRDLFDWYRTHSQRVSIETFTYFETREVAGFRIVDPSSSDPGVTPAPVGLEEDHISLAKPRDRNQQVVNKARELLAIARQGMPRNHGQKGDSDEDRIVLPGGEAPAGDDSYGGDTAFDSWVSFVVDHFLEEFKRLSTNTGSMVCRALAIESRPNGNDVRAGVAQFFRKHSESTTQDSKAVSLALDRIDELIDRAGRETQKILKNMPDWLMTTLVCPRDNPDIAVIRDNCDGVLFVGHPAGAELLYSVAEHRKPDFISGDDGEVAGSHLLNLSSPPIGDQEPLILVQYFLTELADRIGAETFEIGLIDLDDQGQVLRHWARQLSLWFKVYRQRFGSRCYCCCPLPADASSSARMISLLRDVSDQITDLGVFRLHTNKGTLSAEEIIVPLLRKRFEQIL